METYFVSLIGPLLGCYLKIEDAPDKMTLRVALHHSRLKRLWCSIYTRANMPNEMELVGKPAIIIPCRYSNMPEDWHKYEVELTRIMREVIR